MSTTTAHQDRQAAWIAALDALEADVAEAETMLADERRLTEPPPPSDLWRPPAAMGALPLDLKPRADAILDRQLAVAEEIARRLASNRQQAAMTARIETGEAVKRPVYLDRAM
ncbi:MULTISPECIES: hypothetical protein [Actinoplanes]|uniref:hypothetical protein n=1 Tax=Actinoplanes TaxID=1865 RepID=UPI0005F28540|nr:MULTISPECIES: hypothetical protein [Actinoplanes]GLY03264.1 hypothetical protein Acsp01_36430 [Actinoplanes sp. NBRC 101535]